MSLFWRLLLLLVLALGGALLWRALAADPGYLHVVWAGWSVETTLLVAVAAAVLLLSLIFGLLWLIRLPFKHWRRARQQKARRRLADGLLALHRGEWRRAEHSFAEAMRDPRLALAAAIQAEHAARHAGRTSDADSWLARARDNGGDADLRLLEAQRLLDRAEAAAALAQLDAAVPVLRCPRALLLRVQALCALDRAAEALPQLAALRKSRLLDETAQACIETETAAATLTQASDANRLLDGWQSLSRTQRRQSSVTDAFVSRALALNEGRRAARAIEDSVKREWDDALAARYGELDDSEPRQRIKRLETWLEQHPESPHLQLALGRLCRREQLWGKAQDYLDRALKRGAGAPAWETLAELNADRHDLARARLCYRNALRLRRGEAAVALPAPSKAVSNAASEPGEQRDANGMPVLRED